MYYQCVRNYEQGKRGTGKEIVRGERERKEKGKTEGEKGKKKDER